METAAKLALTLKNHPGFSRVIFTLKPFRRLDFSSANTELARLDLTDATEFSRFVFGELLDNGRYAGIGGYGENRIIYRQRAHFRSETDIARSIHLGTDVWMEAGEMVFAPLNGRIHSFAFNNNFGDYGPTIILEHQLKGLTFFTLYGHLSPESLNNLWEGKPVKAGEKLGEIGNFPDNGDWPSHLHFQVITNIGAYKGDFPGVCSLADKPFYLSVCPDPNLILRIEENEASQPPV